MTSLTERNNIISLVADSIAAGARQRHSCTVIELSERTLQRCQRDANSENGLGDQRPGRIQTPKNALTPASVACATRTKWARHDVNSLARNQDSHKN